MKTRIENKLKRKTNPELVKTIISAKKKENWLEVANLVSTPKRKRASVNLRDIESQAEEGKIIVIPGKVLSSGELTKKLKIVALTFSEVALEKIKKAGGSVSYIKDEIKNNSEAKNIQIINKRSKKKNE